MSTLPPQKQSPSLNSTQKSSTTSKIDLSQLTVSQLRELREEVEALLSPDTDTLTHNDIALEYRIIVRSKAGIVCENTGTTRMNAILNPRILSDAPGRFEHEFLQQVFVPVNVGAYDLFDSNNTTDHRLEAIRTATNEYTPTPGLPVPTISLDDLPGE